ncbi:protein FAR-RED IMPAIRED RESPONSE 1-like [Camellia sinensis]|uniref:protein FAR-RED IMPAIRED RESPONSE 1-like n=1 Tax=Camellia sinensis TaxID=4442 RepID=UPI001036B4A4|nr:protein FAR-RED IMPAIRED RESPONSE 1-like [Camellia sinensis]
MSTTQRSESMHAFFDGYINSKTILKQFVEQYENALAKKVENENGEEFNSLNSYIPCITQYPFEKQFQKAYTIAKFKEFQQEVVGQLHCNLSLYTQGPDFSVYEVSEDVPFGENLRLATFIVYFDKENFDTNCSCRLFEFRGIVCRHQIVVLMKEKVHEIPDKYILRRWNKNVKRCHSKVIINYNNSSMLPETRRYNKMFNVFNDMADLATDCENRCDMVVEQLLELKGKLKEEVEIDYGNNKSSFVSNHHNSTTHGDGVSKSKESRIILDPVGLRQKGRPPCKRKQSMVEKVVNKKKKGANTKKKTINIRGSVEQSEFGASSNIGLVDLGTQESIQVNESEILGPSLEQQNIFQENLSYQMEVLINSVKLLVHLVELFGSLEPPWGVLFIRLRVFSVTIGYLIIVLFASGILLFVIVRGCWLRPNHIGEKIGEEKSSSNFALEEKFEDDDCKSHVFGS